MSGYDSLPKSQQNFIKIKAKQAGLDPKTFYQQQQQQEQKQASQNVSDEKTNVVDEIKNYIKEMDCQNQHVILSTANNLSQPNKGEISIVSILTESVVSGCDEMSSFYKTFGFPSDKKSRVASLGIKVYKRYEYKAMVAAANSLMRQSCVEAGGNGIIGLSYQFCSRTDTIFDLVATGTCIKYEGGDNGGGNNSLLSSANDQTGGLTPGLYPKLGNQDEGGNVTMQ